MAKRTKPIEFLDPLARIVVRELGGTKAVADLFGIKQPSVSGWLEKGIPPARLMYLELRFPGMMQKARGEASEAGIVSSDASDDTQPPVGGISKKTKESRVRDI